MFEFLFKYPRAVFQKGSFVLAGGWPRWLLVLAVVALAAFVGVLAWHRYSRDSRTAALWLLRTGVLVVLLLLLWQPAVSISTLRPEQNIIAVVVDSSRSMVTPDAAGGARIAAADATSIRLINDLQKRFQVRLYRLGDGVQRVDANGPLTAGAAATHIAAGLDQIAAEGATAPIGAIVLLSDGSDNSGGIDLKTLNDLRQRRIPVHTVGFGRERPERDIEMEDVQAPAKVLANSRTQATVSLRQFGFAGRQAQLVVREGGHVLASRSVTLADDGRVQNEPVLFNAGPAAVKDVDFEIQPLGGEENAANNRLTRVLYVSSNRPRILYVEGEPRWEYKFIRRAVEDDKSIDLVSILRTTQNKIYRQGIATPDELKDGFPTRVEDLFGFSGLIVGSVEAGWFTSTQQEMIRQFVDRRGGGLLFLGGRAALADGGYEKPPFNDLLPVSLPDHKDTFHRDPGYPELTPAGRDSLITRIEEDPEKNAQRWHNLPYVADFQEIGPAKPGAVALAEVQTDAHGRLPLLVTEHYGRGRTAVFATGGSWRWQMLQPVADMSHEMFWRQMLRWLSADTPTRVTASTPQATLEDDGHVRLRAEVRDTTYLPTSDAQVEARVIGPDGATETIPMRPDATEQGVYTADEDAAKAGSYVAEIRARRGDQELGADVLTFRRENGVAENFHREQNRDLLEKLSAATGGQYWRPDQVSRLPGEISYSEGGISVRETRDLWDMPAVFLLMLALLSGEWVLRRKWGMV